MKAIYLTFAAAIALSACAGTDDHADKIMAAPVDCSHAQQDLKTLNNAHPSAATEAENGVTAVLPVGAVIGIASGTEGDKFDVASGGYDEKLDKKSAAIEAQCGVSAQPNVG